MEEKKPKSFKSLDAELSAKRKSILIESAKTVIQKSGIKEATLREIAKEAQVTTGAIYHYFKNQEHILAEVYASAMKEMYENLDATGKRLGSVDGKEKVVHLVTEYQEFLFTDSWVVDIIVGNTFGEGFDAEAMQIIISANADFYTSFTRLIMPRSVENLDDLIKSSEVLWTVSVGLVGMYRLSKIEERARVKLRIKELVEHAVNRLFDDEVWTNTTKSNKG